ncbi:phosphoglycerate dehydrogenase-like enzyme [Ilumatobacter fluminis]|uniref:Phosphoglycerate dehydrogenase-like enzyme n=1 Tax=Ilumatobacter fluminis TaxID=467091 RepID=A0A4R7I2S5_9ACTN|nr:D-2-hydroxyacid dehydrogenase [Ilumatobacter fluminis]TDT17851.1 phosphoglycerate dehydrogenase-like enzyme [Ilumatobacter fluminis]
MTTFERVLLAVDWGDDVIGRLVDRLGADRVTRCDPADDASIGRALRVADAAITSAGPDARFVAAPSLRWLHVDHAGIDRFAPVELVGGDLVVTTSAGRSGPALGEHALALLLAVTHRHGALERSRQRRAWTTWPLHGRAPLVGRRAVVFGCGNTGSAFATRAAAMGMSVVGVRRTPGEPPPGFDDVVVAPGPAERRAVLADADVVVLAVPLTDDTHHLVGSAEFAALPDGAVVVNVARGAVIDESALVAALRSGRLGGAGLDVVTHEPLGVTSALWRFRNVVISPHATPRLADRDARSLEIVESVLDDLDAGRPVRRRLTAADAYTKSEPRPTLDRLATSAWLRLQRR